MSLSPLPFVLAMISFTCILNKIIICIETKKQSLKINRLLYLNDLKLYNEPKAESESLLNSVLVFREGTKVKSGLEKCTSQSIKGGQIIED